MDAPSADETPRPVVPDYTLLRVIGRGGYGDVWLARGVTGVYRAVKIVQRAKFRDDRPYEREFAGVRAYERRAPRELSQLALLHVGRNDTEGFFYYAMELADDVVHAGNIDPENYRPLTLREYRQGPPLTVMKVVELGVALAGALGTLHRVGLVHRDVKPSNVIIAGGVPKLADIGLIAPSAGDLTAVGTVNYQPESGAGRPSADTFALGKVLYELATGLRADEWPQWPAALPHGEERKMFRALNHVLTRACDPRPEQRYRDGTALQKDLLLVQALHDPEVVRQRVRRLGQVVAVLAAVATVALGGAWGQYKRAEKAEAAREEERRLSVYAATLARAQRALEQEDFGRARVLLGTAPGFPTEGNRRGLEWRILRRRADGDPSEVLRESGAGVDRLALSSDGTVLAVKDESRIVELRDAETLAVRRTIAGVHRLAGFSTDGRWIMGTDTGFALQRWSVADGGTGGPARGGSVFRPIGVGGGHRVVAFTDGDPAALVVWDFEHARAVVRRPLADDDGAGPWEFFRGAASEDGEEAVVACVRGRSTNATLRISRLSLRDDGPAVHQPGLPAISAVGFGRAGSAWAVEASSGVVWRSDQAGSGWRRTAEVWPANTSASGFDLSPGAIGTVRAADAVVMVDRPGARATILRGHAAPVSALASLPAGDIVSGTTNGELRRWRRKVEAMGEARPHYWTGNGVLPEMTADPAGRNLVVSIDGERAAVLEGPGLRERATIVGIRRIVWFDGERYWAEGKSGDSIVAGRVGVAETGPVLARGPARVVNFGASLDRTRVAVGWSDGVLSVVAVPSGRVEGEFAGEFQNAWPMELDERGERAWMAWVDRRVVCIELGAGRVLWARPKESPVSFTRLLPASRQLLVGLGTGELDVLSAETGELVRRLPSGSASPEDAIVTHGDARVVVVGGDGYGNFFDPRSWTLLASVPFTASAPAGRMLWLEESGQLVTLGRAGELSVQSTR